MAALTTWPDVASEGVRIVPPTLAAAAAFVAAIRCRREANVHHVETMDEIHKMTPSGDTATPPPAD